MKNLLSSLSILLFAHSAFAQHKPTIHRFTYEKNAQITLSEIDEDWSIHLQHLEAPGPGTSGYKAELRAKKQNLAARFPATGRVRLKAKGGVAQPVLGNNYEGGPAQGTPNDNDVAVNLNNQIVSVVNSRIRVLDPDGELLSSASFGAFSSDLELFSSKFDPKVVYDPNADRFVVVFLNGSTFETSRIVVGFSQTNDPEGEWNLYNLPGNPIDNDTWSDYPVIGISTEELFIGINTFVNGSMNNSGFIESCLWQIDLSNGYDSTALNTAYYSDILEGDDEIFSICPVKGGIEPYGPDMYFLSDRTSAEQSDTLYLLHITGTLNDPDLALNVDILNTPQQYFLPITAPQPGGHLYDTGDNRILSGFLRNGQIQWVQNTTDTITGTSAILHGTIVDPSNAQQISVDVVSDSEMYFGYPNISSTGGDDDDRQSIITFNITGDSINSGFAAINYSSNGNYSEPLIIKEGEGPVNVLVEAEERWGDYSGSHVVSWDRGHIWATGSHGKSNGAHGTWVAELFSPEFNVGINENPTLAKVLAYPNPTENLCNVEFWMDSHTNINLKLFNSNGQLVKLLFRGHVKPGKSRIQFSLENLKSGNYFVQGITTEGKKFAQNVIVK